MNKRHLLATLKEVRNAATMDRAGFGFDNQEYVIPHLIGLCKDIPSGQRMTVTEFIKRRTRIWRESWIIGPLDELIADIEKTV